MLKQHISRILVMLRLRMAITVLHGTAILAASGLAASSPDEICDSVAHMVSRETNVPISVLQAITRTETGRNVKGDLRPWPWTVNMEGAGHWFNTEDEARAYVFRHFKRGARSFDVGCFQINYKWHGEAFSSIDEMFDPLENARYAARFLTSLYAELGSWPKAAGAYHSRTPEYASRYTKRFNRIHAKLANAPAPASSPKTPKPETPRRESENLFPLLVNRGSAPRMGSLVPLGDGGRPSLFSSRKALGG